MQRVRYIRAERPEDASPAGELEIALEDVGQARRPRRRGVEPARELEAALDRRGARGIAGPAEGPEVEVRGGHFRLQRVRLRRRAVVGQADPTGKIPAR